jgi:N utilization substance protein B
MNAAAKKISPRARAGARRCAVQALYQWQMTGHPWQDVINDFMSQRELEKADKAYFRELVTGAIGESAEIDQTLGPLLDRPVKDLDPIEHAILLVGVYELKNVVEAPWRVIINEAVELAKLYGAEQAHRFINGVMDKAAQQLRTSERTAH